MEAWLQDGQGRYGQTLQAEKVTALIDGHAYFMAFMAFAARAKRRLVIMGWDFDTRLVLIPSKDGVPALTLGAFLQSLLQNNPQLEIKVLCWDFAAVYLFDRQLFPELSFESDLRARLTIKYDGLHAVGASQHQKVVLIDQQVVFLGGVDFGIGRHDTPEHLAVDPLRNSGFWKSYPPVHDVQIVMEGKEVGDWFQTLALSRWELATGEDLKGLEKEAESYWPEGFRVDLENESVLVSMTRPTFAGVRGAFQIQDVLTGAIARAERFVYLENQYFTSDAMHLALRERMRETPDLIALFVLPSRYHGKMEEYVVGYRQRKLLHNLKKHAGKNRVLATGPALYKPKLSLTSVHSKILIVDDRLLSIGSANFNNRSMGMDFEVNLTFSGQPGTSVGRFIQGLQRALLSEHMGLELNEVDDLLKKPQRMEQAIELGRKGKRGLLPLSLKTQSWQSVGSWILPVIDGKKPLPPARLIQKLFRYYATPLLLKPISSLLLFYLACGCLVGLYVLEMPHAVFWDLPWAVLVLGFAVLPLTLSLGLVLASQPLNLAAIGYFMLAIVVGLIVGHGVGFLLRDNRRVRNGLTRRDSLFAQHGFKDQSSASLAFLRLLPVQPFVSFNVLSALVGVSWWRSLFSMLLSLVPVVCGMGLLVRIALFLEDLGPRSSAVALALLIIVTLGLGAVLGKRAWNKRKLRRRAVLIRSPGVSASALSLNSTTMSDK